jgi:hypothetical protein
MKPIRVGLVADPASPTEIARRISDLDPPGGEGRDAWDIEVVSEPFTIGSEDVDTAIGRLSDQAREHEWDLVVGLTELPLRDDDGRYLLVETEPRRRTAVLSLPALGGLRMHARSRHAVRALVGGMADPTTPDEHRVPLPRLSGRWRLLVGMVPGCRTTKRWTSSTLRSNPAWTPAKSATWPRWSSSKLSPTSPSSDRPASAKPCSPSPSPSPPAKPACRSTSPPSTTWSAGSAPPKPPAGSTGNSRPTCVPPF